MLSKSHLATLPPLVSEEEAAACMALPSFSEHQLAKRAHLLDFAKGPLAVLISAWEGDEGTFYDVLPICSGSHHLVESRLPGLPGGQSLSGLMRQKAARLLGVSAESVSIEEEVDWRDRITSPGIH